jgi:hypothetical protein
MLRDMFATSGMAAIKRNGGDWRVFRSIALPKLLAGVSLKQIARPISEVIAA